MIGVLLLVVLVLVAVIWSLVAQRGADQAEIATLKDCWIHLYQARDFLSIAMGLLDAERELAERLQYLSTSEVSEIRSSFLMESFAIVTAGYLLGRERSRNIRDRPLLNVALPPDGARLTTVLLQSMELGPAVRASAQLHNESLTPLLDMARRRFNEVYAGQRHEG